MRRFSRQRAASAFRLRLPLILLLMSSSAAKSFADSRSEEGWPQWGGTSSDFITSARGLADVWPAVGPPLLWRRPLGDGYSAIVANTAHLYTMVRHGKEESVVALDRKTGATVWERRYPAPFSENQTTGFGSGPQASPLLIGTRLITIGFTGILHCLDAATGAAIWSYDLVEDFGGTVQYYGYSSSPLAYGQAVLALVGGKHGVISFRVTDGKPLFLSGPSEISYASPTLIEVDGQDQCVFFSPTQVLAVDPTDGRRLWSHDVINGCRVNCSSVVWGEDNLLWAATKGSGGTRVLKLSQANGETSVEEIWSSKRVKIFQWNAVRVGDRVFTSSGDSTMFYSEIDVKTGRILQKLRGFGRINTLVADGKLIFLDEDGLLALARWTPSGLSILARSQVFESRCWTAPTLVGKTLYLRDQREILALDLGDQEVVSARSSLTLSTNLKDKESSQ